MIPEDFFFRLPNPQVFTGLEINAVRKPVHERDLSVCLAFPDTYEIGMSHGGLKILYHLLNDMQGVFAERAFLPAPDAVPFFRGEVPLFTLERRQRITDFDVLGFSLMSELNFTNVLLFLELSRIPLRSVDRGEGMPLVGAGGIAISNPEPMRDFIDFFAPGDGEVLFPLLIQLLKRSKQKGLTRMQVLGEVDQIEGFYVPLLHPLEERNGFLIPQMNDRPLKKQILREFKDSRTKAEEIIPLTNVVFNRFSMEIARGCPQGCRFCQAKAYYSPYRIKPAGSVLNELESTLMNTGYESFSLSSLSSGDHPGLEEILQALPRFMGPDISFSVPSLRPASLGENLLKTIMQFRRTGITIVPEAGSQRLRAVLNKKVSEEEIFQALDLVLKHGWQRLKVYFMFGLPTETDSDIEAISGLLRRISEYCRERKRSVKMHASFSPFVPKPHTPFQWAEMNPLPELYGKIDRIRRSIAGMRNIQVDFHSPQRAVIETILSRGDARVGNLIQAVFREGETFTAWQDQFHFDVWEKKIHGMHLQGFLKEIPLEAELPWAFVQMDLRKEFLRREYERALSAQESPSCSERICSECAGCWYGKVEKPSLPDVEPEISVERNIVLFEKIRIFYKKHNDFRFLSHLSMMQFVERLLRRSGFRFKCTEGFHPRIRISSLPPLPVHAQSLEEAVEVYVEKGTDSETVFSRLQKIDQHGIILRVEKADGKPSLGKSLGFVHYHFVPDTGSENLLERIELLLGEGEEIVGQGEAILLKVDYSRNGQERFSGIYKMIDPEKKRVRWLTRMKVEFKDDD